MSFKDWRVRVDDILEAMQRCRDYVAGMDEEAFAADNRTCDAVARNLEIIGEAAHKIPVDVAEANPEIPWQVMAQMRHILIHEYHSVDPAILHRTVIHDLPPLLPLLQQLLAAGK